MNSTTVDPEVLDDTIYAGVVISLMVISLLLIVFLTLTAYKAFKYMTEKDRILLAHVIFLELCLICKNHQLSTPYR